MFPSLIGRLKLYHLAVIYEGDSVVSIPHR